jgi:hypothetical protein
MERPLFHWHVQEAASVVFFLPSQPLIKSVELNRLHGRPRESKFFNGMKFQGVCSLIAGLFVQAFSPAGPDGNRESGSHLTLVLKVLAVYRSIPALV